MSFDGWLRDTSLARNQVMKLEGDVLQYTNVREIISPPEIWLPWFMTRSSAQTQDSKQRIISSLQWVKDNDHEIIVKGAVKPQGDKPIPENMAKSVNLRGTQAYILAGATIYGREYPINKIRQAQMAYTGQRQRIAAGDQDQSNEEILARFDKILGELKLLIEMQLEIYPGHLEVDADYIVGLKRECLILDTNGDAVGIFSESSGPGGVAFYVIKKEIELPREIKRAIRKMEHQNWRHALNILKDYNHLIPITEAIDDDDFDYEPTGPKGLIRIRKWLEQTGQGAWVHRDNRLLENLLSTDKFTINSELIQGLIASKMR